jgi:hypothetical protein
MTTFLAFSVEPLLQALVWGVWIVLNLWIWQKSKAQSNLLMLIGAAVLSFAALMWAFGVNLGSMYFWLPFIGSVLLTIGFYMSVKTLVEAHLAAVKAKLKSATQEKKP